MPPVKHTEGAVLVIAGAGSGKTRVLTSRIAYLLEEKNVPPYNILAITFTNKATVEMRERLMHIKGYNNLWVSTFHSLCAKLLRMFIENFNSDNSDSGGKSDSGSGQANSSTSSLLNSTSVGGVGSTDNLTSGAMVSSGKYNRNFSIYTDTDKERVLKEIVKKHGLEKKEADRILSKLKYVIGAAKNDGLSGSDLDYYLSQNQMDKLDKYIPFTENNRGRGCETERIVEIFLQYDNHLQNSNALDFDDLLLVTYKLLKQTPSVLQRLQNQFRYIHVDEFQDTNKVQFKLLKLLYGGHKNIFAVGDEDQSIYGWRGADINNILDFENEFGGSLPCGTAQPAAVYKLEQNYRSTKRIIDCANLLIKNNKSRKEKTLYTQNAEGVTCQFFNAHDEYQEAEYIIEAIAKLKRQGYSGKDFAILMRVNALSNTIENQLLKRNIPYIFYSGFKFYERREIKDILAYLRFITNPLDTDAFKRIINTPRRGIGDTAIAQIEKLAVDNKTNIVDVVLDIDNKARFPVLSNAARSKLSAFKDLILHLKESEKKLSLHEYFSYIIETVGFMESYKTGLEDDTNRIQNIHQLVGNAVEFSKKNKEAGLADFLQSVTLTTTSDEEIESEAIVLSTIHACKGLEFRVVFVVGLDENIFPVSRANYDTSELEEERRLLYVAITRAKELVYFSRAKSRFYHGQRQNFAASRFLKELGFVTSFRADPSSNSFGGGTSGGAGFSGSRGNTPPVKQNISLHTNNTIKGGRTNLEKPTKESAGYALGKKVMHPKFGEGTIIATKGDSPNLILSVAFEGLGIKDLSLQFAPIELLN